MGAKQVCNQFIVHAAVVGRWELCSIQMLPIFKKRSKLNNLACVCGFREGLMIMHNFRFTPKQLLLHVSTCICETAH